MRPLSIWSATDRAEFPVGRDEIVKFLQRKWAKGLDYRLIKELWTFAGNRIAVRFAHEWHDDSGHWFRSYGNENWEFADNGLMQRRIASINDRRSTNRTGSTTGRWDAGRTIIRACPNSDCKLPGRSCPKATWINPDWGAGRRRTI